MQSEDLKDILTAFFECPEETATALQSATTLQQYAHKDILLHQGDRNSRTSLIMDGDVQLQIIGTDGQITLLSAHGPGEIFGAFPAEMINRSDAIVRGKLTVLEINNADLLALLDKHSALGSGMAKILAKQFNAALDRMAARVTLSAVGRVYAELLRLSGESDHIAPPPVIAALALSAQTTRETGSRAINALERRGIIRRDGEGLEILSRRMLEDMVV